MRRNRYYTGPKSDHFDGARFHPPGLGTVRDKGFIDILRWRRTSQPARWPASVPITPAVPPERSDPARITMVGHASVLIQLAGLNILTDPVWSERASPVRFAGPRRVTAPGIALNDLPPIDAVLISHNHYDHLDLDTLARIEAAHAPLMVMPLGTDATVRRRLPRARIVTADWHETVEIGTGVIGTGVIGRGAKVTLTPANHWSARGLRDKRMALWSGFWIDTPAAQVWFAGDTGFGDGKIFHDIRARHGRPDLALIPIGAYEPRWFMAPQHVAPEDSVRILTALGARRAIAIHWGTFQLTDEPREEPPALLARALAQAGLPGERFLALEPGEVHQMEPATGAAG